MTNDYGHPLEDFSNDVPQCVSLLAEYLNKGYLGLLLGAGVSKNLKLPNWSELVISICNEIIPSEVPDQVKFSNEELKTLTQRVKNQINDSQEYFNVVKKHLYSSVSFDFHLASKELLIALSSLFVGKKRGNVSNVITYNFDSVFEWYFDILGLDVNTITKDQLLLRSCDVNITHIHGYLPHDNIKYGPDSDFLIFSKEEFLDRVRNGTDYWKDHFYEFFRRQVFLTIGLSPESLENDVFPYLEQMDFWYKQQNIHRMMPYGVAILTPGASTTAIDSCLKHGVIPCTVEILAIPNTVFEVCKIALDRKRRPI